jgi:hypothetical protein
MSEPSLFSLNIKQNVTDLIKTLLEDPAQKEELSSISSKITYPDAAVFDYKTAAISAGWTEVHDSEGNPCFHWVSETEEDIAYASGWKELCQSKGIAGKAQQAVEYHEVSEWLAGELKARGELVSTNCQGMIVWARFPDPENPETILGVAENDPKIEEISYWFEATMTAQTLLNGR